MTTTDRQQLSDTIEKANATIEMIKKAVAHKEHKPTPDEQLAYAEYVIEKIYELAMDTNTSSAILLSKVGQHIEAYRMNLSKTTHENVSKNGRKSNDTNRLTMIVVSTQFEGWHRWPDAPQVVEYLRNRHRHLFKVRVGWTVSHTDRQLEFFIQLNIVNNAIKQLQADPQAETWSCETWAGKLLDMLDASSVEVSEDGENAAMVWSR